MATQTNLEQLVRKVVRQELKKLLEETSDQTEYSEPRDRWSNGSSKQHSTGKKYSSQR